MFKASHLDRLEAEAIYVIREAAAQFSRLGLLFSGGKDSIVVATLAHKAFYPAPLPFPLVHIDTGHNFPETLAFRDKFVEHLPARLVVGSVEETIRAGRAVEETSPHRSRNAIQSITLLETIAANRFDAVFGGARRDEEKARAKERFFSHRDAFGQWDPKNQRAEFWNLYNGAKGAGEHFRVFPISNWTELDVWSYLRRENIELPSLYFTHEREVVEREGQLLAFMGGNEPHERRRVRFRTIGDITCTGAISSTAANIDEVIEELTRLKTSERGTRADDQRSDAAMEERKRVGYF